MCSQFCLQNINASPGVWLGVALSFVKGSSEVEAVSSCALLNLVGTFPKRLDVNGEEQGQR
jgi:hypothetical protein